MGLVSAMRKRAVSCAVKRNDPKASHWMFGKAAATGEMMEVTALIAQQAIEGLSRIVVVVEQSQHQEVDLLK